MAVCASPASFVFAESLRLMGSVRGPAKAQAPCELFTVLGVVLDLRSVDKGLIVAAPKQSRVCNAIADIQQIQQRASLSP